MSAVDKYIVDEVEQKEDANKENNGYSNGRSKVNGVSLYCQSPLSECMMKYLAGSLSNKCVDLVILQKKIIKQMDLLIEKLAKDK